MEEFRSGHDNAVPEIPFALCLHDVLGYVHPNSTIDYSSSEVVELCWGFHNVDFIAEKSRPASVGVRDQRFIC